MNSQRKDVSICEVVWIPRTNVARHDTMMDDERELSRLTVDLYKLYDKYSNGWSSQQPIKVVPLTEEERKEAIEYLEKYKNELDKPSVDRTFIIGGAENKLNYAQMVDGFRLTHEKNGKITPKYKAVYGHQRGRALIGANALRKAKGESPIDTLPVDVCEMTPLEFVIECGRENIKKHAGEKEVTSHWPSLLKLAWAFNVEKHKIVTLSEITELLSADPEKKENGIGQKIYPIIALENRFQLGLVDKILTAGVVDGKDKGQEYCSSLNRQKLLDFEMGTREEVPKGKEKVTLEQIKEYLANPESDTEATVKPLSKKALTTLKDNVANLRTKYIIREYLAGSDKFHTFFESPATCAEDAKFMEAIGLAKDGKLL